MTIGDFYDNLKEIVELERTRGLMLGMGYGDVLGFRKFMTSEAMEYMKQHNNILITEDSSDVDKKLHKEIEEINQRISMLKNVEIT